MGKKVLAVVLAMILCVGMSARVMAAEGGAVQPRHTHELHKVGYAYTTWNTYDSSSHQLKDVYLYVCGICGAEEYYAENLYWQSHSFTVTSDSHNTAAQTHTYTRTCLDGPYSETATIFCPGNGSAHTFPWSLRNPAITE